MKKYILSIAIFLVLLLASAIFLPYLFKDQIIRGIKDEANKQLVAELNFDDNITINIFKSFPNLNLGFNNISIIDSVRNFENDTFIYAEKAEISLDLLQFYKEGIYNINNLVLDKPFLNAEVNSDTLSSWDIVKPSDEITDTETELDLNLEQVTVVEGRITYNDIPGRTIVNMENLNHTSNGTYDNNELNLNSETEANNFEVIYNGISYVNRWHLKQSGKATLNLESNKYSLPNNSIQINGLPLEVNGYTQLLGDDIDFDFEANATTENLNRFLSLIPAVYATEYADIQTKGKANMAATFKGLYSTTEFPSYDLKLAVENGWFKYPSLPLPAEDLNLDLHVFSSDGNTDKTVVDIPRFHAKLNGNPFDGSLNIQDLFGDPYIAAKAIGLIDLGDLKELIPLPEGTKAEGELLSNVLIEGRTSAINLGQLEKFKSSGSIETTNLVYQTSDMPETLDVSKAKVVLKNQKLDIPYFTGKLGSNEIEANGMFSNFFAYLASNDVLRGDFNLQSNKLNLNDFTAETPDGEESEMTLIEIPGDIDISLDADVNQLIYDDLEFTSLKGSTQIQNRKLIVEDITSEFLGGVINLDGNYAYDSKNPFATFDIAYSSIKISKLLEKFKIVQVFAPIAEQIDAMTTAKLSFASLLNSDMSPQLANINLSGALNLEDIAAQKIKSFEQLDNVLGTSHFSTDRIEDFFLNFNIKKGKLFVDPFEMFIDSSKLSLEGISKIDGGINYNGLLSIPASYIAKDSTVFDKLAKGTAFEQFNLKATDFLNLAMSVTGSVKKPVVTLNLKQIKESFVNNVKSAIRTEIDKQKEEAKTKAEEEVTKIKEETEKKVDDAKSKALEEIEKKKKEAAEKLKLEAEERKKRLKEEAEKGLKDIFKGLGGNN